MIDATIPVDDPTAKIIAIQTVLGDGNTRWREKIPQWHPHILRLFILGSTDSFGRPFVRVFGLLFSAANAERSFALAKGFIRGLTRCSSSPWRIPSTIHFWMYVEESVRCLSVDTLRALDLGQMGVVGWGQP